MCFNMVDNEGSIDIVDFEQLHVQNNSSCRNKLHDCRHIINLQGETAQTFLTACHP